MAPTPLLRGAFSACPLAGTLIDADGTIVDVNDAFVELAARLGRTIEPADRIGHPVEAFADSVAGRQRLHHYVDRLLSGELAEDLRWSSPGVHLLLRGRPVRDPSGQVVGAVIFREDVTQQEWLARRRQIIDEIRHEIWRMAASADLPRLLTTVRNALRSLGLRFDDCGVNLIAGTPDRPAVRFVTLGEGPVTEEATEDSAPGRLIVAIHRDGRPAYRPDLLRDDPHGERTRASEAYPHAVRSVVDVPFSRGTLAVNSTEPDAFSRRDIEALGEVARVLSEAFQRVDDFSALEARNRELEDQAAARRLAEQLLRQSHERLEELVAARTADLRAANQELHREISHRERERLRLLALDRVRGEIWKMELEEDTDEVLRALRQSLQMLGMSFRDCGINVVDDSTDPPLVHSRIIRRDGLLHVSQARSGVILDLWNRREPVYRRDLAADDPLGEREAMERIYRAPIRSVLDVPFALGTLAINSDQPNAFSDADIEVLRQLAGVLSEAFRRAVDMRRLREHAEALEAEVAERIGAEERLRCSLQEKEVLLQEVHHRVKNNLQIVSSLIDLQSRRTADDRVRRMFEDSRDRIKSMTLVHDQLYRSGGLVRIDLATYVRSLTGDLVNAYGLGPERLITDCRVDDLDLDMDQVVAVGLIVNELVSNAVKHAFPAGRPGTLRVDLARLDAGRVRLMVSDDGVGLPAGIDLEAADTLGLRLVSILARQLQGTVEVAAGTGTSVTVAFPHDPGS